MYRTLNGNLRLWSVIPNESNKAICEIRYVERAMKHKSL